MSSPSSQHAMRVPTLTKFAEFAQTVSPANRDDIIKIGNILAGDRFLATTIARVAGIDRGDIMEVIKQVNPVAIERWVTEIEDYLEIKFVDAFTTPRTSRAPKPSRGIGKSRPPRFTSASRHPGIPTETLGERLARTHELDRVTLPVTIGSYIRLEKGKMTKRHLRKLMRDVRSCQSPQPVCSRSARCLLTGRLVCHPGSRARRFSCGPSRSSAASTPTSCTTARSPTSCTRAGAWAACQATGRRWATSATWPPSSRTGSRTAAVPTRSLSTAASPSRASTCALTACSWCSRCVSLPASLREVHLSSWCARAPLRMRQRPPFGGSQQRRVNSPPRRASMCTWISPTSTSPTTAPTTAPRQPHRTSPSSRSTRPATHAVRCGACTPAIPCSRTSSR